MKLPFVYVENVGRLSESLNYEGKSIGTAENINQTVVEEVDINGRKPKMPTKEMINWADVTMGCSVEEVCSAPILAKRYNLILSWQCQPLYNVPVTFIAVPVVAVLFLVARVIGYCALLHGR